MIRYMIFLSVLLTFALAVDHTGSSERELAKKKKIGLFHHRDLAILYALLAIKFKAVLFVGAVILGAILYFKLFSFPAKLPRCPPVHLPVPYETHPFPPHDRHDRSIGTATSLDFDLLRSVIKGVNNGWDFNETDAENEYCKRKLVCEAKKMSVKFPVVKHAMKLMSDNLAPYRTSETERSCTMIFPQCSTNLLKIESNKT